MSDVAALRACLRSVFGDAGVGIDDPSTVSGGVKGAYLLILHLEDAVTLTLRKGALAGTLPTGTYLYAGNAYGSGGLRARLSRHCDKTKKPHWHVDHVTMRASKVSAIVFPGGGECDLVARLLDSGQATVLIPRFGSSDCRVCPSHFLRWNAR